MNQDSKITIIAFEYPPFIGGVGNYAAELTRTLYENNKLNSIISMNSEKKYIHNDINVNGANYCKLNNFYKKNYKKGYILRNFLNSLFFIVSIIMMSFFDAIKFKWRKDKIIFTSCFLTHEMYYVLMFAVLKVNYKIVLHGLDIINNTEINKKLFKIILNQSKGIIVNSDNTKNLMQKKTNIQNCKKVEIVYPIINTNYIDNLRKYNLEELETLYNLKLKDNILCFFIGRLVKRKGVDILINAFETLIKNHSHLKLVIAGTGPEEANLKKQLKDLNLANHISLIGKVADNIKFSFLEHSNFFISPTRSLNEKDFEGFGIVFIEASYMNNIVIGGDHGGVKESIEDGINGYRINFDNKQSYLELSERIDYLIKSNTQFNKMLKLGRMKIINEFTKMSIIKK